MLLSAKQLLRWPLPSEDGSEPPITYVYAAATVPQRLQFQRELRAAGAKFVSPATVRQHLRDFVLTLDDDADRARVLELLDARDLAEFDTLRAAATGKAVASVPADAPPSEEDAARQAHDDELLAMAQRNAEALHPAYREAAADHQFWWDMTCLIACRLFLRGLEGPEAPRFEAPHGIVSDATLARLGFIRIRAAGVRIMEAMTLQESEAKN